MADGHLRDTDLSREIFLAHPSRFADIPEARHENARRLWWYLNGLWRFVSHDARAIDRGAEPYGRAGVNRQGLPPARAPSRRAEPLEVGRVGDQQPATARAAE